jgi:hypothetical protein
VLAYFGFARRQKSARKPRSSINIKKDLLRLLNPSGITVPECLPAGQALGQIVAFNLMIRPPASIQRFWLSLDLRCTGWLQLPGKRPLLRPLNSSIFYISLRSAAQAFRPKNFARSKLMLTRSSRNQSIFERHCV